MQYAFLDEYGSYSRNFEADGVSSHFIVGAVLVKAEDLAEARDTCEGIRQYFFGVGEIKSKNVKAGRRRRVKILDALARAPMKYMSVVVDKRELENTGGLIYKKPFLKYIHGRLARLLFRSFNAIEIVADEHGWPEFMSDFEKYIERKHRATLFSNQSFRFANSQSEVLIQAADFVAGSFARLYDPEKVTEEFDDIRAALVDKTIVAELWPPRLSGFEAQESGGSAHDGVIRDLAERTALTFIDEKHSSNDSAVKLQVDFIQYLLYVFRSRGSAEYVSTDEVLGYLREITLESISVHYFRSQVVAQVRENGVIIASSQKGYKLPCSTEDLLAFVAHSSSIIGPMLRRLKIARKQIKAATHGEYDILSQDSFQYLATLTGDEIV